MMVLMAVVVWQAEGVTLPKDLVSGLGWEVGDPVDVVERDGGLWIGPRGAVAREALATFDEAMEGLVPIPLPEGMTVMDLAAEDRRESW